MVRVGWKKDVVEKAIVKDGVQKRNDILDLPIAPITPLGKTVVLPIDIIHDHVGPIDLALVKEKLATAAYSELPDPFRTAEDAETSLVRQLRHGGGVSQGPACLNNHG